MSENRALRVLVVDEEVPFPLNTGKKLRTFNLLRRLQEKHSITYVCYGDLPQGMPKLPNVEFIRLNSPIIPQQGLGFYLALFRNIFSKNPYVVDRHYSAEMKEVVEELLQKNPFDLLYCEWTPYTPMIKDFFGAYPSVLSTHNVEAQIWKRLWEIENNLPKKTYIDLQRKKMHLFEKEAVNLYSEITAVSLPDKELLQDWYRASNVTVVPNGVDETYFARQKKECKPYSIVFTGSMDWRPNQDAMKYFLNEIYPLVLKSLPKVSLTIVGRKPPEWLEDLAKRYANVTVTGTVDDVRPFIAEAALYIVPLRIGGGSRLKILEALSMGKVVLSTSIGAEGLAVEDSKHLLLRDDPKALGETVIEVLTHPASYQHLATQGRRRVLESYTWDAIAKVMDGVWQRAAGKQDA
jgi:glycosyltransferase involved in cell wall biosynthesis